VSIVVIAPGTQATLQGAPRRGLRHFGMPYAGAADPVSLAIANRLAGQGPEATAIEVSYGPAVFRFEAAMHVGLAGADAELRLDGILQPSGQTLNVDSGTTLEVSAFRAGSRLYLAVSGRVQAQVAFGSPSTYLPAGFGGHEGRALRAGDVIGVTDIAAVPILRIPPDLKFAASRSYALRAVSGPDLQDGPQAQLGIYTVTQRISRMGAEIDGALPAMSNETVRPSSAVMPGALQVTPSGCGFLLLADGQTTGGYPHLLQVIRADRHLLGQLRPSDRVQFLLRSQTEAEAALKAKQRLLDAWLPGFRL
jgi:biotin-dependent carboxylase-like uncharacterized protein